MTMYAHVSVCTNTLLPWLCREIGEVMRDELGEQEGVSQSMRKGVNKDSADWIKMSLKTIIKARIKVELFGAASLKSIQTVKEETSC